MIFHLGRCFVVVTPNVFDILSIQTSHRLPLKHVVLSSSLELSLFSTVSVESVKAVHSLIEEITERSVSWPCFKTDWFFI